LINHPTATVVSVARQYNEKMPARAIEQISNVLGGLAGLRCLILGVSYRAGVKETAFSGSLQLLSRFRAMGVEVFGHDPLYSVEELSELGFIPFSGKESIDFAILQNDWAGYKNYSQADLPDCKLIFDGRRILSPDLFKEIIFMSI
jgi:UDP-N-acetyl-D-mannosaminuronate dehydrogenase